MNGWLDGLDFFRSGGGRKVEERREKEKIEGVSIFLGYFSVTRLVNPPWFLFGFMTPLQGKPCSKINDDFCCYLA